jgi:DNA repair protein RecO (recombination protein O)
MKTQGLIIKSINYGEANKILTMLTPCGKVQMVANGAKSHKSHLFAGSQLFCYSRVVMQKGRGKLPYLKSCEIINNFYRLRTDIEKIALGSYFLELLDKMALQTDCEQVLRLILNTLYILETKKNGKDLYYIKPVFELRLLCILGFQPEVFMCVRCGKDSDLKRFSSLVGGVLCSSCKGGVEIMADTLEAMRHIILAKENNLFSFALSESVRWQLIQICENFVLHQLEIKPKTLDFYNKLTRN